MPAAIVLLAMACLASAPAFGQCGSLAAPSTSAGAAGGDFNTAGTWNNGAPTASTNTCIINGTSGSPATVTLATGNVGNVLSLQVGGSNTLNLSSNTDLFVSGSQIINGGSINMNAAASDVILGLNNSVTLMGSGTLTLATTGNGAAIIQQQVGGLTLTSSSNIVGAGTIGNGDLAFSNSGTLNANASGQTLTMNGLGIANSGLLEATNGGTLQLSTAVTNTGALANITANGGTVNIATTINGGTLNSLGGGTLQTSPQNVATLNGVTISSGTTYINGNNADLFVSGSIVNNGAIQLNAGASDSILGLNSNTTLSGGGTLTLSTTGNGAAIIQQQVGGVTLTNTDNTIQGAGTIGNGGLTFINNASVLANATGQTLTLNGSGVTNTSLLEATNGGTLQLDTVVTNTGANITANGGTVNIATTINGGTLSSLNGGTLQTSPQNVATLNAVTLSSGTTYINGNNADLFVSGSFVNNGAIQLNAGASDSILGLNDNTTLSGGGTITLSTTGNGAAIIQEQVGGLTLTNTDNTIQGAGTIGNGGLAFINNASVLANATGQTLTLNGSGVTNTGLLEATNGGTLQISTVVNNNNANITANGGAVLINSTIQGGTLTTLNGGTMGTNLGGISVLDGSTQGAITLASGSTYTNGDNSDIEVLGTVTNKGTIQLNAGASDSIMLLTGSTTLNGGGTVSLSTTGNGAAVIEQAVGGLTLTNVDNTIQGAGIVGNGGLIINNEASGTISANLSGQTLTLSGGTVTNTGLLQATNGGTLQISTVIDNANGNITANGGAVLSNSTIQGGTLNTLNGGTMGTNLGGLSILDGSTQGAITLSAGSTYTNGNNSDLETFGTIVNKGNIQLSAGASDSIMLLTGSTTLNGGGNVTLSTSGNGTAIIEQGVGGLTLNNAGNTIQGAGIIGNGGLTVVNGGTLLANVSGGTLLVNGSGGLTNNGTLQVEAGSMLHVTSPFTNFSGGTLTGGTYNVAGAAGTPGILQIDALGSGGGEIVSNASTIVLNGPTAEITDSANMNALSGFQDNLASGSFTVEGGQLFSTNAGNGNFTNAGTVDIGANSSFTNTGGEYVQTGGTTQVDGTLTAQDPIAAPVAVSISGGLLSGTGTINGNVDIGAGGTISPGDPGTLSILGNYTQEGTLGEEIAGPAPSSGFDVVAITGTAVLGSNSILDILLLNGFTPTAGQTFTILTSDGLTGTFGGVENLDYNGGFFTVDYTTDDVILDANGNPTTGDAAPEPVAYLPIVGIMAELVRRKVQASRKRAMQVV